MKFDVFVVDTWDSFENLKSYAEGLENSPVVIDTETDSKYEKLAKLHGLGFSFQDDEAFYIPVRDKNKNPLWSESELKQIGEWVYYLCKSKFWIGYNAVYDTLVLENNFGRDLSPYLISDPILQKHAIDEERPFGLKEVSVKYLGPWADKAQQALYENIEKNGGKTTKDDLQMWKADIDVLAEYCCWDTILTRKLYKLFEQKLKDQKLLDLFYRDEVMPLYRECTIEMKRRGFAVDVEYFQKLKEEITADIIKFEDEVMADIKPLVEEFEFRKLDEEHPVSRSGHFPKALAKILDIELPTKPDGKVTLAQAAVAKLVKEKGDKLFYVWLRGEAELGMGTEVRQAQKNLFFAKKQNQDKRHVFNLSSPDQLRWLFFTKLGIKPTSFTETGEPSVDEETLDELRGQHAFVDKILDYRKLCKLEGTYISGILDRQVSGVIYTSFLQFGTTSGRYASRDPNLQNLPRLKDEEAELSAIVLKYVNAIKKGFVAPQGKKLVNADYSALEPVCFAHMSGDVKLQDVFRKGQDLYSAIAIDVFKLKDCSADKKAPNFLKKIYPEKRQLAKIFCLAVVYGAGAGQISAQMGIPFEEAQKIINDYLSAYPNLKKYMRDCEASAIQNGYVRSVFGRIRHMEHVPAIYRQFGSTLFRGRINNPDFKVARAKFRHAMNNAKNFPIQSLATHIMNRAMIATSRAFKAQNIDGYICANVHDEVCCVVREDQAEMAKSILRDCMQNTTKLSVPLQAEPLIGNNWAESK